MNIRSLLLALASLALGIPAAAQEAAVSAWAPASHSRMRLIAGATAPSGKQRIGIEIVMAPGYRTYWRNPGGSGSAPAFDWGGSVNVGGLDVRWPAPERFSEGNGFAAGYRDELVLPVSVQPVDPAKPVLVALKFDYVVCGDICIPARGEAHL